MYGRQVERAFLDETSGITSCKGVDRVAGILYPRDLE